MILIDTQKEEFTKLKDIRIFEKMDNEQHFNGDLLVIGLGGMGSKVVCNLKGMLMDDITQEDNINFLMVDSDIPFMEEMIEASREGIGLNATEIISIYRPNLENILVNGIANNPVHPNLANWMCEDFPQINIDTDGAKGNRQIGRLMFSNAYEDMRVLLFDKIEYAKSRSKTGKLDIIIVSGVAGGTSGGILTDLTYNVRAYIRSKKWTDVRVGACLMMPDILYSNRAIASNPDLLANLNANGYATLKEIDYYMRITQRDEAYTFESTTHRLALKQNIFDSCLLVSGKKDDQGYIPDAVVYSDVAYFLSKLATYKYVGNQDNTSERQLLRDMFFNTDDRGYYKVINESDYKIPIKEIENICEYEIFVEAYKKLHELPEQDAQAMATRNAVFGELYGFLSSKPGEEIVLSVNGIIPMRQFEKPAYKMIKKNQDGLRENMAKQLTAMKDRIPIMIKALKNHMLDLLDNELKRFMQTSGPYAVMDIIGCAGIGSSDQDRGMIADIQRMIDLQNNYQQTGEFSRIIESIKEIVAKRFFTFPSAKRETEDGYYDACVKETLTIEKTMLIEGMHDQDMFGDIVRWLRAKAERLEELYAQFNEDLKNAVEDLATNGRRVTGYLLKDARQQEFLPSDFITQDKIDELHKGIVKLLADNEANIDNGRVVEVRQEMERVYKNILIGVGMYAPEKLIAVAFADQRPNLAETNMMFVSPTNETRNMIMHRAARAFVEGSIEKTAKKQLCVLKPGFKVNVPNQKYISLPAIMPFFSQAVAEIMMDEPYKEPLDNLTMNTGDVAISIDDMYHAVPLSMLECIDDMRKAYDVVPDTYKGLHIDEVNKDMRNEFPGVA